MVMSASVDVVGQAFVRVCSPENPGHLIQIA
jgi:hypothetical protein